MRVLLAASEAVPFAKTGGLADVVGSLPAALAAAGHEPIVVLPLYGSVDRDRLELTKTGVHVEIRTDKWTEGAVLWNAPIPGGTAWLLENDALFGRASPGLYGENGKDYADNSTRFAFFCHVIAQLLRTPPDGRPFDVLHAHDWQAALAPVLVKTIYRDDPSLAGIGTVLTIHNLAYQGNFPAEEFAATGLPAKHFTWKELEFYGKASFLKGGLVFSDILTTVSKRYAEEILTKEFGCGLEGLLAERKADLAGVLNGVDYEVWSPDKDRLIPARFSAANPSPKELCRSVLLREVGLPRGDDLPVLGMVSRMVEQKGFDLIEARLDRILDRVRFVLLGSGNPRIEEAFRAAALRRPDRLAVRIGYDDGLAHRIEAGSDLYLMPSAYEPCGLNQIYSLRYGAVPVVRATGGLDDTVIDADVDPARGTGFKFERYDADTMLSALDRALSAQRDSARWAEIRRRGMTADFSWGMAAIRYAELYERARARARNSTG